MIDEDFAFASHFHAVPSLGAANHAALLPGSSWKAVLSFAAKTVANWGHRCPLFHCLVPL